MALEIQHAALWKSITQRLNIEHTYTAHASFHTALDIYVMAVGHNNTTVGNIQYAAHSTISTRQLKSTTRTLNITTRPLEIYYTAFEISPSLPNPHPRYR